MGSTRPPLLACSCHRVTPIAHVSLQYGGRIDGHPVDPGVTTGVAPTVIRGEPSIDLRGVKPLDLATETALSLEAHLGLMTMRFVGEKQVPLMSGSWIRHPVTNGHPFPEVLESLEAVLGHANVFFEVELDPNIPVGENRRRLAVARVSFHDRDPRRRLQGFEVVRRGRPHDGTTDNHNVMPHG